MLLVRKTSSHIERCAFFSYWDLSTIWMTHFDWRGLGRTLWTTMIVVFPFMGNVIEYPNISQRRLAKNESSGRSWKFCILISWLDVKDKSYLLRFKWYLLKKILPQKAARILVRYIFKRTHVHRLFEYISGFYLLRSLLLPSYASSALNLDYSSTRFVGPPFHLHAISTLYGTFHIILCVCQFSWPLPGNLMPDCLLESSFIPTLRDSNLRKTPYRVPTRVLLECIVCRREDYATSSWLLPHHCLIAHP